MEFGYLCKQVSEEQLTAVLCLLSPCSLQLVPLCRHVVLSGFTYISPNQICKCYSLGSRAVLSPPLLRQAIPH